MRIAVKDTAENARIVAACRTALDRPRPAAAAPGPIPADVLAVGSVQ